MNSETHEDIMRVIAFHGDGGSARIMRRDMGDPSWVTDYWDWTELLEMANAVAGMGRVVLVGYSRGAARVAWLAKYLKNIAAAVVYESPDPGMLSVPGTFPALLVWNKRGRKGTCQAARSDRAWMESRHPVSRIIGNGRHTRFVFGWPPIGHGWDQSLNQRIGSWIATHAT